MGNSKGNKSLNQIVVLRRERGATLVEVMIAGAVATVLGLGITQMMVNMNKGAVSVQRKDDFIELQRVISMAAQTEAQCQTMFGASITGEGINGATNGTTVLGSINIPRTDGTAGTQTVSVNGKYGTGVYITALELRRPGTNIGGGAYMGSLHIEAARYDTTKPNARVPGPPLSADIPLSLISADGDSMIESCVAGQSSTNKQSEVIVSANEPADCVGSTGTVIQDCVNMAAASVPARTVLIKAGTYTVVNNITVPDGVRIRGEGRSTILRTTMSGAGSNMFNINNAGTLGNSIRDLHLDGSGAGTTYLPLIKIQATSNVIVEGVHFTSTARSLRAIELSASADATMSNFIFKNNTLGSASAQYYGPFVYAFNNGGATTISNLNIDGNYISSYGPMAAGHSAIQFHNTTTSSLKITNNTFYTAQILIGGFILFQLTNGPSEHVTISNNSFTASGVEPLGISIGGTLANRMTHLSITNNTFKDIGGAISGSYASHVNVSGNTVKCVDNGAVGGINLSRLLNATISNNTINNCNNYGISTTFEAADSVDPPVISDNTITFHTDDIGSANGIYVTRSGAAPATIGGTVITGNRITNSRQNGIYFQDRALVTNNFIKTRASSASSTTGILALSSSESVVTSNYIENLATAGTNRGIWFSGAVANSNFAMLNNFVGYTAGNECVTCSTASRIYQGTGNLTGFNNASLTFIGGGGITMSGGGGLGVTGGNISVSSGDINISGPAGADINVTGGSNINVSTAGGINVGSGSAIANEITVNGGRVAHSCTYHTASCPANGSTGYNCNWAPCTGGRKIVFMQAWCSQALNQKPCGGATLPAGGGSMSSAWFYADWSGGATCCGSNAAGTMTGNFSVQAMCCDVD